MTGEWITDADWEWVCDRLPIACVDVLPIRRDPAGAIHQVGLARRDSPWGPVWCHVGGRLELDEPLADGARRHLRASVDSRGAGRLSDGPVYVNEFLRERREGFGHDPRKHAVSACYLAEFPAEHVLEAKGEAVEAAWFDIETATALPDLWPGTDRLLTHARRSNSSPELMATYSAISDREVSLNELMWQTPVLAMTAMAFLLTIALGDGEPWQRALSAGLSTVVAVASVQLMEKHSLLQRRDADALWAIERERGMREIHAKPLTPAKASARRPRRGGWRWFVSRRSRRVWTCAMLAFAASSFGVGVQAVWEWVSQGA